MAGLLDIFGSSPDIYAGLLGEEGMAQAKRQAQSDALLNLSASLMKAGAPSRTPQGLGLGLVEGMQAAQKGFKESMQGALQEKLAQQKIAEAIASKQRAGAAQQLLISELQPQMVPEATTGPGGVPYPVNQVRQASLQELIPKFAKFGTEGFDALSKYLDVREAGKSKYQAVGDYLYEIPMEGAPRQVAGQPKGPSSYQEFQMAATNPEYAKFLRDQEAAKAPKIAVDLKDPTAVAKAQADIVKDWRSVVKDSGAQEVADRYASAVKAVEQGNAGNKASDGALIYAIGKIYDPSGAVQEGDKKTILGNRSIPDSVKAYAQRALNGQDLLPHERQGLLVMAKQAAKAKALNLQSQMAPYTSISKQLGGTGDLLLNPLSTIINEPEDSGVPTGVTVRKR